MPKNRCRRKRSPLTFDPARISFWDGSECRFVDKRFVVVRDQDRRVAVGRRHARQIATGGLVDPAAKRFPRQINEVAFSALLRNLLAGMIHGIATNQRKRMFCKLLRHIVEKQSAQVSRDALASGSLVEHSTRVATVS
jgi:hypothetical protein